MRHPTVDLTARGMQTQIQSLRDMENVAEKGQVQATSEFSNLSPEIPLNNLLTNVQESLKAHEKIPNSSQIKRALKNASIATRIYPKLPASWLSLCGAHMVADDYESASLTLQEASKECTSDPVIPFMLRSLHVEQKGKALDAANLTEILYSASCATTAGNLEEALQSYNTVLSKGRIDEPIMTLALMARGDVWVQRGKERNDKSSFEKAVNDFEMVTQLNPLWQDAWFRLGTVHLENGSPARAREAFASGISYCGDDKKMLQGLRDAEFIIDNEGVETDWDSGKESVIGDDSTTFISSGEYQEQLQAERIDHLHTETISHSHTRNEAIKKKEDERCDALPNEEYNSNSDLQLDNPEMCNRHMQLAQHTGSSIGESSKEPGRNRKLSAVGQSKFARNHASFCEDMRAGSVQRQLHQNNHSPDSVTQSTSGLKLYDLLQVPKDASENTIKKSYYTMARMYHPDKNKGDLDAKAKFQNLAEAYRILSDAESRAVYDRYGDRSIVQNSVDIIDPSTLFAMVFGSDQFVNIIGELQLASLASNVDDTGTAPSGEMMNSLQRKRVGRLVLELLKALKPYVEGDKRGFLTSTHRQMRKLSQSSFGKSLLYTVGKVYVQQASNVLDKAKLFNLHALVRKASSKSHRISSRHKATNAALRVMDKQRKLHDRVMKMGKTGPSISDEDAKRVAEEMAQNAIDMMWKISVIDIETTLEDVVSIVLSGRDLISEEISGVQQVTAEENGNDRTTWRSRRIGSSTERDSGVYERISNRTESKLIRATPALSHGEPAKLRHQILNERAHGVQAMGRIYMSAMKQ